METMLKSQNKKDPIQNPILEQCALLNHIFKKLFYPKIVIGLFISTLTKKHWEVLYTLQCFSKT